VLGNGVWNKKASQGTWDGMVALNGWGPDGCIHSLFAKKKDWLRVDISVAIGIVN
jgi:hypothetical protein